MSNIVNLEIFSMWLFFQSMQSTFLVFVTDFYIICCKVRPWFKHEQNLNIWRSLVVNICLVLTTTLSVPKTQCHLSSCYWRILTRDMVHVVRVTCVVWVQQVAPQRSLMNLHQNPLIIDRALTKNTPVLCPQRGQHNSWLQQAKKRICEAQKHTLLIMW